MKNAQKKTFWNQFNKEYLLILLICVTFGSLWLYNFHNLPIIWSKSDISFYANNNYEARNCTLAHIKECFNYHNTGHWFFQSFGLNGFVLLVCFIIPYLLYWLGWFINIKNLHLVILFYFVTIVPSTMLRAFLVSQAVYTAIILLIIDVILCYKEFGQ